MKNKAYQYAQMTDEERAMTLFYTIEGMVESLQIISNELDPETASGMARLAKICNMADEIESIYDRVHKDYVAEKTKKAINYAI
jgi:tRNA U34 5-methylaminomethyl-2-thiouridine-forming methyltransferase MnmC